MSISGLNIPDQYSPTVYMVQYEFQTEHIQNEIQYQLFKILVQTPPPVQAPELDIQRHPSVSRHIHSGGK